MEKIVCLVILSGKRHTGKDLVGNYIVDQLKKKFDVSVKFLHASNILKRDFTKKYELDYERILTDRSYKEKYRKELTEFYNQTKQYQQVDHYNQELLKEIKEMTQEPTIYVLDIRRKFELNLYEKHSLPMIKIRVEVDDNVRKVRGWVYDKKIDNDEPEMELDDYEGWDFMFDNSQNGYNNLDHFVTDLLLDKVKSFI